MVHEEFVRGFIEECVKKGAGREEIIKSAHENFSEKSVMPSEVKEFLDRTEEGSELLASEVRNDYINKWEEEGKSLTEIRNELNSEKYEISQKGGPLAVEKLIAWMDELQNCPVCENELMWDSKREESFCPVHD